MTDAFIRLPEVRARSGLSRATIYRKMARGEFPQAEKLSANVVAWRESDLERWMSAPMDWRTAA